MIIDVKKANVPKSSRLTVLESLIEYGSMSRADLADKLGLTRPALTEICRELLGLRLIREAAIQQNDGRQGRPSVLLSLNKDYGFLIGVCITNDSPTLVICDLHGNIVGDLEISYSDDPQEVAELIRRGIEDLLKVTKIPRKLLLGIGIAISGFVDPFRGLCLLSSQLGWHNVAIAEIVQRATGLPVYVENDANSVANGEKLFGQARKSNNFSIIVCDHSIGAGHYIQGRLYRGHNGGAGEIGHCTMVSDGKTCSCGKTGCLDTIAGGKAILDVARAQGINVATVLDLEETAIRGNKNATDILRNAGRTLGLAASYVIQISNPEILLFTFTENLYGGIFLTTVRQVIENNILPSFLPSTTLLFHRVDKYFWARGAAATATHGFLREQVVERS